MWIGMCDKNVNRRSFNLPRKGAPFPNPMFLFLSCSCLAAINIVLYSFKNPQTQWSNQDIRYYLRKKAIKFIVFAELAQECGQLGAKASPPKKKSEKSNNLTIKIFLPLAGGTKDVSGQQVWSHDRWFIANVAPSETSRLDGGERWGGRPKLWAAPRSAASELLLSNTYLLLPPAARPPLLFAACTDDLGL